MRGAFVAGLFAGMAMGALVVLACQDQNRQVILVQAGRMADMARTMMNNGTNRVAQAAAGVASTVASNVAEVASDMTDMA